MSVILYSSGANGAGTYIRPAPLASINWSASSNATGRGGGTYNITLTGTLLDNEGAVSASSNARPPSVIVSNDASLAEILKKQIELKNKFSDPNLMVEIIGWNADAASSIKFYPKLVSINFDQGLWVNKCDYTIELEAGYLIDNSDKVIGEERYDYHLIGNPVDEGGFIKDYSESWSLEPQEGNGNINNIENGGLYAIRIYKITRTINAVGAEPPPQNGAGSTTAYNDDLRQPALQAKMYVLKKVGLHGSSWSAYPGSPAFIASGAINISETTYGGYNHLRSESIDLSAGSYSLTDTWILSSGTSFENYNVSITKSVNDPVSTVNVNGTITGLTSQPASGSIYVMGGAPTAPTPYENAALKYQLITNNGSFGPTCQVYRRASRITCLPINPTPKSISIGSNEFTGEITYNIEYDDRPSNIVSGVLSESISVNDTYPGDVFAIIPVLGRATGPILQYLSCRTEYQRTLNIDLVMDRRYYEHLANAQGDIVTKTRNFSLLTKPSLVEPFRSQINGIISAHSPARDLGVRKYFLNPPSESWDAKTGNYSLTMNWVYELNR